MRYSSENQRIAFIDSLRALTILLVVYQHFFVLLTHVHSTLNHELRIYLMPLFFFIIGFFLYSTSYSTEKLLRHTNNRIVKQLIPTVIFFLIYVALAGFSFNEKIVCTFKAGYWFTFVSVEIFFLIGPLLWYFSANDFSKKASLVVFSIISILSIFAYALFFRNSNNVIVTTLDINQITQYVPYVIMGGCLKMYWDDYRYIILRPSYFLLAVSFLIVCYMFHLKHVEILMVISGIYSVFYLFFVMPTKWFNSRMGRFFSYIGTLTLEIYLLHYFIILAIPHIPFVNSCISQIALTADTFAEFPVVMLFAIAVACCCIGMVYFFKRIKIYNILFPSPSSLQKFYNYRIFNKSV